MPIGEKPIRSFEELLRATGSTTADDLADRVNDRIDGNGFVETEWDEGGVNVTVGFGTRGLIAEFTFPFRMSAFWTLINEYADEVESLDEN